MANQLAYTINEMVEVGRTSRSKIYEDINAGKLRARKNGTRTIILHNDAVAYLEALPTYQPRAASQTEAA